MLITPPETEQVLLERAHQLSGKPFEHVAAELGVTVPKDFKRDKGWVGQLLERALGADAGCAPAPDFTRIGVELKTLPLDQNHQPKETTFVCTIDLLNIHKERWETGLVRKKLAKVLWVPIQADPTIPIAERCIGAPLLWQPSLEQEQALKSDWEELTNMIALGELENITARHGTYLQIRPKGASGKSLCWGFNEAGEKVQTLPRGFYLRTAFTKVILEGHYL